jgi:hypothetical protein
LKRFGARTLWPSKAMRKRLKMRADWLRLLAASMNLQVA